jgi:hypothetical protein
MAARLVAIPTTHMKSFCLISRTIYITPVTRVNICMKSIIQIPGQAGDDD